MNPPNQHCTLQYNWVKETRQLLLRYLSALSPEDLIRPIPSFGNGGSLRDLLVHTANVYQHWIGHIALKTHTVYAKKEDFSNIPEIRDVYREADALIAALLDQQQLMDDNIIFSLNGGQRSTSGFRIFTHVITHEFHHKGQLLSMSRLLGHTPVDTDIIHA